MPVQMPRKVRELAIGETLLVGGARNGYLGRDYLTFYDSRPVTIVAKAYDCIDCVEANGDGFSIPMEGGAPHWRVRERVLWTAALPKGEPSAVKAYCDAVLTHDTKALALYVTSVNADGFEAELVQVGVGENDGIHLAVAEPDEEDWTGVVVGQARFWDRPVRVVRTDPRTLAMMPRDPMVGDLPGLPEAGDLVIARGYDCRVVDGTMVTRVQAIVRVGAFGSREAVAAFLPDHRRDYGYVRRTATHGEHVEAQAEARARMETDEALVLWTADGDDGSTSCAFLAMTGIAFHHVDAVEDMFYGANIAPGLYLFKDPKWSTYTFEGEHDVELEGDWVAATPEDCARLGFADLKALDAEILDRLDAVEDPSALTAERLMAQAAENEAAQAPSP